MPSPGGMDGRDLARSPAVDRKTRGRSAGGTASGEVAIATHETARTVGRAAEGAVPSAAAVAALAVATLAAVTADASVAVGQELPGAEGGRPGVEQQDVPGARCGAGVHVGEADGFVFLPEGSLFCPLVADPKGEHSFLSVLSGDFPSLAEEGEDTRMGAIGLGDEFPLARWGGSRPGNGLQVGLSGGVFAQFDLRSASFDLINADYVISLPVTLRRDGFSLRIRPYHQSSHLGDEFLLRGEDVERENLSFESLELILSQEVGAFRIYGGGEVLFRREPESLEEMLAHAGAELRIGVGRGSHFVVAVDVKSSEEQDWDAAVSVRSGVEIALWREHGHPPRTLGILGEYYRGPSPYGQFFQSELRFLGLGLHFSL